MRTTSVAAALIAALIAACSRPPAPAGDPAHHPRTEKAGRIHDERHAERRVVGEDPVGHLAVLAQGLAVIRRHHHERPAGGAGVQDGLDERPEDRQTAEAPGKVNSLTVFNAALNMRLFWDGRPGRWRRGAGPIVSPDEMGSTCRAAGPAARAPRRPVRPASPAAYREHRDRRAGGYERTLITTGALRPLAPGRPGAAPEEVEGYELLASTAARPATRAPTRAANVQPPGRGGAGHICGQPLRVPSLRLARSHRAVLLDGSQPTLETRSTPRPSLQLGIERPPRPRAAGDVHRRPGAGLAPELPR
jgi:hypothetical protein